MGLIRNPEHDVDVRAAGAEPVLCDLEDARVEEVERILIGAGAVVFAAGAGPVGGLVRMYAVDQWALALMAEAAEKARVRRFIHISCMGAGRRPPPESDDAWAAYVAAKSAAEDNLRTRDLDWTILRPGRLTDERGLGLVTLADPPLPLGEVSRDDVADVIAALLDTPETRHRILELIGGGIPVEEAIRLVLIR
ncbi:NAD(P)H-binding protein [Microbispora hainanensis]